MNFWFIIKTAAIVSTFISLSLVYFTLMKHQYLTNYPREYSVLNPEAESVVSELRSCLDKVYFDFFDSTDYLQKYSKCVEKSFPNIKLDEFETSRRNEFEKFLPLNSNFDQEQCIWLTIGIHGDTKVEKQFKEKYPGCSVYGIEANKNQYSDFSKYGTMIPYVIAPEAGLLSITGGKRSDYTEEEIKSLAMADLLDRFVGQRTIHYATIDVEGSEYSILDERILSRHGIVFCQINVELHPFWSVTSESIEEFLNRFNSPASHYVPIFTAKFLEHRKVTFINVKSHGRGTDSRRSKIENSIQESKRNLKSQKISVSSKMKCEICVQYTGCRRYGGFVCAACAAFFRRNILQPKPFSCKNYDNCGLENFQILKCQSCRFKRCFQVGMKADRVKPSSPRSSEDEFDTVNIPVEFIIFSQVLENLVEVCREDPEGTMKYLQEDSSEVLQKASGKFIQNYRLTDLSKRTKNWSLILYRSNVKQEELPLLFQLTVIHFSYMFYNFFDNSARQKLSAVIQSAFRFQELESTCKKLISKVSLNPK